MASNNEAAPAAAETPAEPTVVYTAPAPQQAPRRNGLAIAGVVVGSVIAAGALFGGGVAVGAHLPDGHNQSQAGPGFGPGFGDGDGDHGGRPDQNGGGRPGDGQGLPGQGLPGQGGPGQMLPGQPGQNQPVPPTQPTQPVQPTQPGDSSTN